MKKTYLNKIIKGVAVTFREYNIYVHYDRVNKMIILALLIFSLRYIIANISILLLLKKSTV